MSFSTSKLMNWWNIVNKYDDWVDVATVTYYWNAFRPSDSYGDITKYINEALDHADFDTRLLSGGYNRFFALKNTIEESNKDQSLQTSKLIEQFVQYRKFMTSFVPYQDDDKGIDKQYTEQWESGLTQDDLHLTVMNDKHYTMRFINLDTLFEKLELKRIPCPPELKSDSYKSANILDNYYPTKRLRFVFDVHCFVYGSETLVEKNLQRHTSKIIKDILQEFFEKKPDEDGRYTHKYIKDFQLHKKTVERLFVASQLDTGLSTGGKTYK